MISPDENLVLLKIKRSNIFSSNASRCNFSDMEIEMFFARYDQDGDFVFSPGETNDALEDLENDTFDDPNNQNPDARPLSGKQAREARSARIRSAASARSSRPSTAGVAGVGGEEFGV